MRFLGRYSSIAFSDGTTGKKGIGSRLVVGLSDVLHIAEEQAGIQAEP
jgi:hypothetical protein